MRPDNLKKSHLLWRYPLATLATVWVVCSLLLAVMGPFGSYLSMSFADRLLYWGGVVGGATILSQLLRLGTLRLIGRDRPQRVIDAVVAPAFAVIFAPPLYFVTEAATDGRSPYSMLEMLGLVLAVTAVLIVLREILGLHAPRVWPHEGGGDTPAARPTPPADAADPLPPPIIDRLPDAMRGEVLSISSSDHYVDIKTDSGATSILLRFSDALREVEPVPGQRVHRSHWVADAAVARMRRDGKRHFVVLKSGDELPVSRTYAEHACQRWGEAAE